MHIVKSWKIREVGTEALATYGSSGRALHCEPGRALCPSLLLTAAPCQPCHGAGVALVSTRVCTYKGNAEGKNTWYRRQTVWGQCSFYAGEQSWWHHASV